MPPHQALDQDDARGLGGREGRLDLVRIARVRLLAEHVLAGCDRAQRPFVVQLVGQRDVHGIDAGVGEQRVLAAVCPCHSQLERLGLGARELATGDRHHAHARAGVRAGREVGVDAGGREQSDRSVIRALP